VTRLSFFIVAASLLLVPAAFAQQGVVSFTASTYTTQEKGTFVAGTVITRTGDLNLKVGYTVRVTNLLTNESFTESGLFETSDGKTKFASWFISVNTGKEVPLDDKYYNPGRKYHAVIESVTGATIGAPSTAEVDIIDDDSQPTLSIGDILIDEGNPPAAGKSAVFVVRLTTPRPVATTVPYTVRDGSAKKDVDYLVYNGSVFFAPDQTTAELYTTMIPDRNPEGDETFFIDLGTPSPSGSILMGKTTGMCTIIDDDGPVGPLTQRVAKGAKGVIHINLTDPAPSPETIVLDTPDAFLSVPASVSLPAGSASVDVEYTATAIGNGSIMVTLPPSRARTYTVNVAVFEPVALTLDPLVLTLPLGTNGKVTATIEPKPPAPITLRLAQTTPSVADIPANVVTDATGTATIPVHSGAVGFTSVSATLPDPLGDINGSNTLSFVVLVNVPAGLAITSLSQKSGRASGGETVKVSGNNFSGPCVVTFGGVPSQTSELPAGGAINVMTPPHDAGVVDVGIRCGNNTFVYSNAFTYTASALTATNLSPGSGGARGGAIVTVRGTNLRAGICIARFGGAAAHAIAWGGTTSMTVATPAHAAGNVPVTLTCGGESVTLAGGFTYFDGDDTPATIATVLPIRVAPGDRVTLTGTRFRADDAVFINGIAAESVALTSSTTRIVTVPEMSPANAPVSLRDIAGRTTAGPKIDVIAPPAPAITQMDARLTAGAEFTVFGSGFRGGLTFALGPAILPPLTITTTRVLFRAPSSLAAGPTPFTISDHGTTLVSRFVDMTSSGFGVTAVAPPCSVREGGALATISGSGFENGAMVLFGGTYSPDVVVRDHFTLLARIPPAFGSDTTITVINPDGAVSTLTNAFAYRSASEGGCGPTRHRGAGH
jgi:hypothetical protein